MSTGSIENWAGTISEIGPIYPFVGSEFVLFLVGMAIWIGWTIWQIGFEKRNLEEEVRKYGGVDSLTKLVDSESAERP